MSRDAKGEDGFASRWSRLKQEAKAAPEPPVEAAPDPEAEQAEVDSTAVEKTDAEILEELALPDPDAMKMGDDFSAFMSPRVPTRLRNRALRRLWRSNPVLANLDQLNDYDGDFTDAATAGQVVVTAYQVGRGFVKKAAALLEEGAEGESPGGSTSIESEETDSILAKPGGTIEEDAEAATEAEIVEQPENPPTTPRKTMRFTFDDGSV